jgi:hypothetical protein
MLEEGVKVGMEVALCHTSQCVQEPHLLTLIHQAVIEDAQNLQKCTGMKRLMLAPFSPLYSGCPHDDITQASHSCVCGIRALAEHSLADHLKRRVNPTFRSNQITWVSCTLESDLRMVGTALEVLFLLPHTAPHLMAPQLDVLLGGTCPCSLGPCC